MGRLSFVSAALAAALSAGFILASASGSGSTDPNSQSAKASLDQKEQAEIASAQAAPRPAKTDPRSMVIPTTTPCSPPVSLPFPQGGIVVGRQGGPFGSGTNFSATSSWVGTLNTGATYAVWAGAKGVSPVPAIPAVDVYTQQRSNDGCGVTNSHVGTFLDSAAAGPLVIQSVSGSTLVLSGTGGHVYRFDLLTHTFA
jgi:hypothetical protein